MGVTPRSAIAAALIDGGLDPATPVVAIRAATTSDEVVARCRIDQLGTTPVDSPATIVIGAVADLDVRPPGSAGPARAAAPPVGAAH
jgi:siroheme synthase